MTDRLNLSQDFLRECGWANARSSLLAGDASNRTYFRLRSSETGKTAVLMDAPPAKGEDVRPFIQIAEYLAGLHFSAPEIWASDTGNGFLLLEDLGDDLFARVLAAQPALEETLYAAATDVLIALHRHKPPPDLAPYDTDVMSDLAALAFDWYAPQTSAAARQTLLAGVHSVLARHVPRGTVLIQRDYHAENLLWLPDRKGIARVGLLDFQSAMLGHPAYDLVSLLQDARRDVSPDVEQQMIRRYIDATGSNAKAFETAYHCLGVQRNLRILGVFSRLCIRGGKAGYIDLIPRVWSLLQRDLAHPKLTSLAEMLVSHLPEPTPQILSELKCKCASALSQ